MNDKTLKFVNKAKLKHIDSEGNPKYLYSKVDYITAKIKVIITCLKHGDFEQVPNYHLTGNGCSKCGIEKVSKSRKKNTKEIIEQAKVKHGKKYTYERFIYSGSEEKSIITCSIHGDFLQNVGNHLRGSGCPSCVFKDRSLSRRSNLEDFISRSNLIHDSNYTYEKSEYNINSDIITVTCSIHGNFYPTVNNHLRGSGCPSCANLIRGHTRTQFKDRCFKNNKGLGIFYVIQCSNDSELFYKIGITSQGINKRYSYDREMPYDMKIIHEIKLDPTVVYDLENKMLRDLIGYSYKPNIHFAGVSECFNSLDPINEYLKNINIAV